MASNQSIYQSAEHVPITGQYEMVRGTGQLNLQRVYLEIKVGEVFPFHDGVEVCWHLIALTPSEEEKEDSPVG
jgi:hypothetical protein